MVSNIHYIELFINGELMELESQESLNLRLNNVLFNPTKTSTVQGEYSYSFTIPDTPNNSRVLNYGNCLAKTNKFHARYSAQVYADSNLIFDGSLTVQKYSSKEKMYTCNLVNIKINSLDEIFGEAVLTDVDWSVDFNGGETINEVNADLSTKYFFPLVSYGAFAKRGTVVSDEEFTPDEEDYFTDYTSKFQIDDTNKFYIDSFYPSLNVMEELKKCFEWKGYNVGGSAFNDPIISNIYASTNLGDEQQPTWNVGNPKFGRLELSVDWTGTTSYDGVLNENFVQDLRFPYFEVGERHYDEEIEMWKEPEWNFTEILITPMLKSNSTINVSGVSAMYTPNTDDNFILIPADGFYKIDFGVTTQLLQQSALTVTQYGTEYKLYTGKISAPKLMQMDINPDFRITTPIEIQLVKNYSEEEDIELIKGKNNIKIMDGNPEHVIIPPLIETTNYYNYTTCFPHEAAGSSPLYKNPTKPNEITDWRITKSDYNLGYNYKNGELMCYDPIVSKNFICGLTTMGNKNGGGCLSVIKNGKSWSKQYTERTDALYYESGYNAHSYDSTKTEVVKPSIKNKNIDNPIIMPQPYFDGYMRAIDAECKIIVYLKKNDKLELMAVRRNYWNDEDNVGVTYSVAANVNLTIEAATPEDIYKLRQTNYGWNSPIQFPNKLNLMNFTNNELKVSEWIKNITDAFNLSIEMNGNQVDINTQKGIKKTITYAVDLDDRVNNDEVESEFISYPREMSVQYKIDTDEWGYSESVPEDKKDLPNWKDFGDSGFTIIKLSDDSYEATTQNKTTQFSYTWYDNFIRKVNDEDEDGVTFRIPVISKMEYMIDGYNQRESERHRGYKLPQRFWFRPDEKASTDQYRNSVLLQDDLKQDKSHQNVYIYAPLNKKYGINLSYKDTETSIVTEYFNIYPMLSSNYVTLEAFLNPEEYINIRNGALVHFDDDLHYISEIQGYDPTGFNKTKLKLIKKV